MTALRKAQVKLEIASEALDAEPPDFLVRAPKILQDRGAFA